MCGRISTAGLTADSLKGHFNLDSALPFTPGYNLAPTLEIPAIREHNHRRSLATLKWGLVPHWARDKHIRASTFNARAETVTQKPFFRDPIKSRRCIIPASGFYEWQTQGDKKQPYYIARADQQPLALAGLWDLWEDQATGDTIESCTIITVPATHRMAEIHERMPAVLEVDVFDVWLDPEFRETHVLQDLLRTTGDDVLDMYPVSSYVNSSSHEGARCIERSLA
jgi:putative SOS response-associated peptidase YedK